MKTVMRILAILFLVVPAAAAAQGTTDILAGKVVGPDGKPVAGAQISATSAELGTTRTSITDTKGRYMIVFPDGGGLYQVKAAFLGMADRTSLVRREADEEVLLTDFGMTVQAIELDAINVQGRRSPTGNGQTGERTQELPQELLNRLPLNDFDPTTLALLAAGVIQSVNDSINGIGGFSVAGMRDALNQITLDGLSIGSLLTGGAGLEVPQEGLRRTQVVTSTFDASRGGFAGGQVSMTTSRGNNRNLGSFTYQLQDASLNGNSGRSALGNASTTHRLSGGIGGPIIRSKLFYQVSFTLQRRINDNFALASGDALADQRTGANPDSIGRFIDILGSTYGFQTDGLTGPYASRNNSLALQTRVDFNITPRHTLMARYNNNLAGVDSTRISPLDVRANGGDQDSNRHDGAISLTSRLGGTWTNELQLNASRSDQVTSPYVILPEGRIRITSDLDDGARSVSTLVFGGDRSIPSENQERSIRLRDEVGFLFDLTHRVKVGAEINRNQFSTYSTDNFYGTYTFNSLEDFENNVPASFARSLSPRERKGGGTTASAWLTDTWRPSNPLQITLGLRLDRSAFDERPDFNPAIDATFGRRTDFFPTDLHLSPRVGFSYRLNEQGQPTKVVRGGIGEFRGNAPFNLFSSALQQTGLPGSELSLNCIGSVVPVPDWTAFLNDPSLIPQACMDGGAGAPPSQSTRSPNVTLFNPGFGAPSSWRANLGYQAQVSRFQLNFDYTYSLGVGLYGVRDINLDATNPVTLPFEGRPFFGDPSAIVTGTGQVTSATSRIDPAFAGVYEYDSGLRSTSHQLTTRVNGMMSNRLTFQGSYTLGYSRDQSSFSGGNGGAGFSSATTAGNPNELEWGTSSNDRRHSFSLILAYPIKPWAQMTLIGRLTSGSAYTPIVSGDVNGDGSSRNDRAYMFNPAATGDTAIANGMNRLLAATPGTARSCIEAQFGTIAGRNSCRNGWTESLDARFMLTPTLPAIGRRLELSADLSNVPAAFDQLFHGAGNLHGWGQQTRADGTLLYARGYDAATNAFKYEVNELFGQSRAQRFGSGAPFQVRLQARVAIGPQQNLGGALGALAFGGGGGGRGGDGGPRGGGGFGGGGFGGGGGGAGGFGGRGGFGAERAGEAAAAGDSTAVRPNPAAGMINRLLPNPVRSIVALKDTLKLTDEQSAQLQVIADSLNLQLQPLVDEITKVLTEADSTNRANQAANPNNGNGNRAGRAGGDRGNGGGGGRGGFGGPGGGRMGEAIQKLQPQLEKARGQINAAVKRAEKVLTKDQWNRVPQNIRNAGQGPGGFGRGF